MVRCLRQASILLAPSVARSFEPDDASALIQLQHTSPSRFEEDCVLPPDFSDWSFCDVELLPGDNTLAEAGSTPDAPRHNPNKEGYKILPGTGQRLRYRNVTKRGDQEIDLVLTVAEGSVFDSYFPGKNGKASKSECFGQLNIMTGSNSSFDFTFEKSNAHGEQVVLENFMFTVYDVDDQNKNDDEKEFVELVTEPRNYWLSSNMTPPIATKVHQVAGTRRFESTVYGNVKDNPESEDLNDQQLARTITMQYAHLSRFTVKFGHTALTKKGREFLFGGRTPKLGCPPPNSQPVCEHWHGAEFNFGLCDKDGHPNMPIVNNLGGLGPQTDEKEEMRFGSVATYKNQTLDLVITNASAYHAHNISRNNTIDGTNNVGVHGCFGVINVRHATDVTLDFTFRDHTTDAVPTFDAHDTFVFSIWDFDHHTSAGQFERVKIDMTHVDPAEGLRIGNRVQQLASNDNEVVVGSTVVGYGSDNPLSPDVTDKSVAMQYRGSATWRVTLEAVNGDEGRNFLFYGCRTV